MLALDGALVQLLSRVSGVKSLRVNDAPSSEVKHCALVNAFSANTVTAPLGWMNSRPLAELHRSTGMETLVDGRKPARSVNAGPVVPLAIAPLRWRPPLCSSTPAVVAPNAELVQPFCRVSAVNEPVSWV